ncbi:MAG TPA: WGR domain-containing protein, partial [Actinoplanes sp.]|nr:WGR domain-containing protein [Actinoplanes sp.]
MRRFEFVEDGSAKFWEIERVGGEVTVRFGRIGSAGQTRVKTFTGSAAAGPYEIKQIHDKISKGYTETALSDSAPESLPSPSTTASPPTESSVAGSASLPSRETSAGDEDMLVVPAAWLRQRTPRRGSAGVKPFVPDPEARALTKQMLVNQDAGGMKVLLENPTTEDPVRTAALAWRHGSRDAPPLGAAAVAALKGRGQNGHSEDMTKFADVWIGERGLTFAAVAAVELMSLVVRDDFAPSTHSWWTVKTCGVRYLRVGETAPSGAADIPFQILLRVRTALAAASEEEFQQVAAALEPFRAGLPRTRVACSVLVPRADWVEADVAAAVADADPGRAGMLIHAAGTAEQAEALARHTDHWGLLRRQGAVLTLVDGLGADAAPALFRWYDRDISILGVATERWLLSVLATLPSDEVMTGLVDRITSRNVKPALLEAAARFPARAMRILAEEAGKPAVAELLRTHVLGNLGLVDRVRTALSPEAAVRVDAIVTAVAAVVTAPVSALPAVLADPPWQRRARAAKPVVITGLTCTDGPSVSWRPDEQEQWARTPVRHPGQWNLDSWAAVVERLTQNKARWGETGRFFTEGPEEIVRPVLSRWQSRYLWDATPWLRVTAARFGAEATPLLLTAARINPVEYGPLLTPFSSPEVAVQMADWLARLKSARRVALAWLLQHPLEAARALIPAALGKAGADRRQAERALLTLHTNGHTEQIRTAAGTLAAEIADPQAASGVTAGVAALLATDPLQLLPARMPAVPAWAAPGLLPPVRLRGDAGALPAEAAGNLVTMLTINKPGDPYAGLEIVRDAVDPADLAEFGWTLFQMWQASGAAAKENWALDVLGLIGDDETVRRLAPLILAWPGDGGHAKAVTGVNVLAAIGTDVALMHLHRISQ